MSICDARSFLQHRLRLQSEVFIQIASSPICAICYPLVGSIATMSLRNAASELLVHVTNIADVVKQELE